MKVLFVVLAVAVSCALAKPNLDDQQRFFPSSSLKALEDKIIRKVINTDKAPAAIGPYSQAIQAGDYLYVSGQIGLNPSTGNLVSDDVQAQTRQALENIGHILTEAGTTFKAVVKCTVLLADINDFADVNDIYAQFFSVADGPPARAAFQVAAIPKLARVEIEAIAIVGEIDYQ